MIQHYNSDWPMPLAAVILSAKFAIHLKAGLEGLVFLEFAAPVVFPLPVVLVSVPQSRFPCMTK